MMALIVAANRSSFALHERMGFGLMGTARSIGYKFDRWIDVSYMQRALGAADTAPPDRPAPGRSATV